MTGGDVFLAILIICGLVAIYSELIAKKGGKGAANAKPKKKAAKPGQPGKAVLQKATWSNDPEQYEATGGATFQEIVSEAARLAAKQKHPVKFGFNRRSGEKQYRVFPGGHFELTK